MKHVLSATQFTPQQLGELFKLADDLRTDLQTPASQRKLATRYQGQVFVSLFYEPSTRTRLSFEIAAGRFGMAIASTENAREFSSAAKGETLEDTIKVINEYNPAVIVMRHHETGAATRAAAVSKAPIVNAGDGKGEHPTQALLDLYTIQRHYGRVKDLTVVIGGDLANGRTARSLAQLLSRYKGNQIRFVSTPELAIGDDIKAYLRDHQTKFVEIHDDIETAMKDADVVYWTRLQKERLKNTNTTSSFVLDQKLVDRLPKQAIIIHPLPRVGEILPEVDTDPRAKYFEQAGNGMFIRMALIDSLLKQ